MNGVRRNSAAPFLVYGDVSAFNANVIGVDNPLTAVNRDAVEEVVQEVRVLSSGDGRTSWIGGLFYQNQEERFNQNFPSPGFDALTGGLASMFGAPDDLFVSRPVSTMEQVAAYGDVSYKLTDRLEIAAGIRWFDIQRDYDSTSIGLFVGGR